MERIDATIKLKKSWPEDFEQDDSRNFNEIIKGFPTLLKNLTSKSNKISVYEYFGKEGVGKATTKNLLESRFPILIDNTDFKGIYLFYHNNEPFYTGISKGVIKRIHQHIKGANHFSSSLSYQMGKQHHFETLQQLHKGTRKELDFKKFSEPFKKIMREECEIAILPISGSIELYLFECYAAIELGLHYYNRFDTH